MSKGLVEPCSPTYLNLLWGYWCELDNTAAAMNYMLYKD